nr:ricin-type beta-trefoil lectin domain protein [Streptomyces sp. HNM0574]
MRNRPAKPVATSLVDQESGKCLAAKGGSPVLADCEGDGRTWVRSIGGRGYFKLKLAGKCLTRSEGGAARLADCKAGAAGQHWWMTANAGENKDGYQVVHRSGGDPVTVGGADTFVMRSA